jgi:hypothetical protein
MDRLLPAVNRRFCAKLCPALSRPFLVEPCACVCHLHPPSLIFVLKHLMPFIFKLFFLCFYFFNLIFCVSACVLPFSWISLPWPFNTTILSPFTSL